MSARARYELGLSPPLSLASIVTLSGSQVFTGATVAVSGLGSALAVAMVVAGRGDPILATFPRCAAQTGCARTRVGAGRLCVLIRLGPLFQARCARPGDAVS